MSRLPNRTEELLAGQKHGGTSVRFVFLPNRLDRGRTDTNDFLARGDSKGSDLANEAVDKNSLRTEFESTASAFSKAVLPRGLAFHLRFVVPTERGIAMKSAFFRYAADAPYEHDSQPVLCYASGVGLMGLVTAFLFTIGGMIVAWSVNYSHQLAAAF
jgi:hypothetical protein